MTATHSVNNKNLYYAGGISAIIVVTLWIIQVAAVALMGTPPLTVADWFAMFANHGPLGLLNSFLLDGIGFVVMVFVFLPLYYSLRSVSPAAMAIATVLKLIGVTLGIATNVSLSMYSLSNQFAAGATEAQKSQIMAAAQAVLIHNQDGTASAFTLMLGSVAGLIISFVMLRGTAFGKSAAIVGILANACQLLEPPTAFAPAGFYDGNGIGVLLIFLSFFLFLIWYIQIVFTLFRLGRMESKAVT
jgi:hypothetical protein